jgi:hypothetical protein
VRALLLYYLFVWGGCGRMHVLCCHIINQRSKFYDMFLNSNFECKEISCSACLVNRQYLIVSPRATIFIFCYC